MNYCVTIASLPATPFTPTPIPLLRILKFFQIRDVPTQIPGTSRPLPVYNNRKRPPAYSFCLGYPDVWVPGIDHCMKNKSKTPWICIFTLSPCGNRCRFGESDFFFASAPPIENKIEKKNLILRWRLAKVAFDTVRDFNRVHTKGVMQPHAS